jgi:hypothetical protein
MTATVNASTSAGVIVTSDTSGALALQTAGTTALTVTSAQNVGIGTTSPAVQFSVQNSSTSLGVETDTNSGFGSGPTIRGYYRAGSAYTSLALTGSSVVFGINDVEKMRLTSAGYLGIGTTTVNNPLVIATTGISGTFAHFNGGNNTDGGANPWLATVNNNSVSSATYGWGLYNSSTDGNLKTYVWNGSTTPTLVQSFNRTYGSVTFGSGQATVGNFNLYTASNTQNVLYMVKNGQVEMTMGFKTSTDSNFYVGTGSSTIGTNGVYLTNGGAAWLSVSDERYKENLVPITDAITKVNGLRSVTGNFIADADKKRRPFLIAQDVLAVLPEAVDTSDAERYGLGYTDLIPLLVASIKELSTQLTELKAEVATLKGAQA